MRGIEEMIQFQCDYEEGACDEHDILIKLICKTEMSDAKKVKN